MRKRSLFTTIAILLGLSGIAFGLVFAARLPNTLTIAVGPAGNQTHRYVEALAEAGRDAREPIRLQIVTTDGADASARMLETGKVDLAVVRSDYPLPANGQTLLVNSKRVAVVIAPRLKRGGIQKFTDLKGKRIAVVRLTDPNVPLVRRMLAVAEIGENDATLIDADLADLPELLGTGKVDAAIAIVLPSARQVLETVSQIARRLPNGIRLVPLAEAEALANRIIGVETAELAAGIFGAGRPQEELATVAISYRIMASAEMSNDLAGRTAKSLYDLRTRVARRLPLAFTAEPPDAKTGARIPAHPGAVAYFEGESTGFLEKNSELILTGLWGASILGSGITGFLAWISRRRHNDGARLLEEIAQLTQAVRNGQSDLRVVEERSDQIVAELAGLRSSGMASEEIMDSASLALDHFRAVMEGARSRVTL